MKQLLVVLLVVGCNGSSDSVEERRRPDASVVQPDAAPTRNPADPGVLSCQINGNGQTCLLPGQECCFSNYDSNRNGSCIAYGSTCAYGTEQCDGPEDCASGLGCYANAFYDAYYDMARWNIACAASPPAGTTRTMCHPTASTCPSGTTCMAAHDAGVYDLPSHLYVCH